MKKVEFDDYNEFDYITLYVRAEKVNVVEKCYKQFLWEVVRKESNNRFNDIVDVTFKRKHKIKNKEDLQLLQIYMEENLNETNKLEEYKFLKSSILGLTLAVFSIVFLSLGLWLIKGFPGFFTTILGSFSIGVCGVMYILLVAVLPKFIEYEKRIFKENINRLEIELDEYLDKASLLLGEEYEKDNK